MKKYDVNLTVDKYIKYKYLDAEKMHNNAIKILEEIIKDPKKFSLNIYQVDSLKDRIKQLKKMTTFEYYSELTYGLFIDSNGDAWCEENPNGKWQTYNLGGNFSMPLITNEGVETHSSLNKDVDWFNVHMKNAPIYDSVWDLVHGIKKPSNEEEERILENMSFQENYFSKFKDKDEYVIHNSAYWNYAFLDENGWVDMDDSENYIQWISTFFDKYCANLNDNDKITIFECTKDKVDD